MSETAPNPHQFGQSMEEMASGFRAMAKAIQTLELDPLYQATVQFAWTVRVSRMTFIQKISWMLRAGEWPRADRCPLLPEVKA